MLLTGKEINFADMANYEMTSARFGVRIDQRKYVLTNELNYSLSQNKSAIVALNRSPE